MPTLARLKAVLSYDPLTGHFTWLVRTNSRAPAGARAGTRIGQAGYRQITFEGKRYYEHRLAWYFVHGKWPRWPMDHVNGDTADNPIANLRLASPSQNQWNKGRCRNNTSGLKGAYFHKRCGHWRSQISKNGKSYHLGIFPTAEEAHAAYCAAARRLFGEFARTK